VRAPSFGPPGDLAKGVPSTVRDPGVGVERSERLYLRLSDVAAILRERVGICQMIPPDPFRSALKIVVLKVRIAHF
jgi:hypothetical protein